MTFSFIMDRAYREQKIKSWAGIGLLVFISAFLWAPSRDGLEAIYAIAFFIPMLCVLPWRAFNFHIYGGWFTLWALLFGGYSALTTLWAPVSNLGYFILQWLILAIWLCGLSWLAIEKRIDVQKIMQVVISCGALVSIISLIYFYKDHPIGARLEGWSTNSNPNNIGSVFGVVALLAYMNWLQAKTAKQNVLAFLCLVLILPSLLFSQSRSSLLAFCILAPVCLWWCKPSRSKIYAHIAALLFLLIAVVYGWDTLSDLLLDRGSSYRDVIWADVLSRSIQNHVFIGQGLEKEGRIIIPNVDVFNHAHNPWLDAFYRTGLIGFLLQLIGFIYVLRHFSMSKVLFPLYMWLFFGIIYTFVDSRGFFWQIDPKWFCYWLPVGLIGALISAEKLNGTSSVFSK